MEKTLLCWKVFLTTTRPLTKFLVLLSGWDCVKKEYPKIVAGRNLRHDSLKQDSEELPKERLIAFEK